METIPDACNLAESILRDMFGTLVAELFRFLLRRGSMTWNELQQQEIMPVDKLKTALIVLIQHGCVRSCLRRPGRANKTSVHVYIPQICEAILNLRKPWFITLANQELDEISGTILEVLLENGRLRLDQLVTCLAQKLGKEVSEIKRISLSAFVGLVHGKFIHRCAPCTMPPPPTVVHLDVKRRTQSKADKEAAERDEAARGDYDRFEKMKYKLPVDLLLENVISDSPGGKRKLEEDKPQTEEEDALWRVNSEELNRLCRLKACVDFVAYQLSEEASVALRSVLFAAKGSNSMVYGDNSKAVTKEEVVAAFALLGERSNVGTLSNLESGLEELVNHRLGIASCTSAQTSLTVYCVNLRKIIECCQLVSVEVAIRDRFGIKALRIFRLLLLKGQLEQKQIADLTMLDLKETRTILYQMLKGGYVHLQDIPQTGDHAASRTFFTWKVSLEQAKSQLVKDVYKAAYNTHSRLRHELKKGNELMELLELSQSSDEPVHVTTDQRRQAGRLSNVVQILEKCLFDLDATLGILSNFC